MSLRLPRTKRRPLSNETQSLSQVRQPPATQLGASQSNIDTLAVSSQTWVALRFPTTVIPLQQQLAAVLPSNCAALDLVPSANPTVG
jgi:hypothetical protein